MSPEVQIELIKALQVVVPALLAFIGGLLAPQPKALRKDK